MPDQLESLTPQYVQEFVRVTARVEISLLEAAALVPLVRGQKAALAALERFDVNTVRPSATFDPREAYAE